MTALLELAERVEAATGPSFALFAEAFEAIHGGRSSLGEKWSAFCALIEADAWLDSAMTLAIGGVSAADVLRHAIKRCSRYGTPTFIEALPRFVASEWLRAHASGETE